MVKVADCVEGIRTSNIVNDITCGNIWKELQYKNSSRLRFGGAMRSIINKKTLNCTYKVRNCLQHNWNYTVFGKMQFEHEIKDFAYSNVIIHLQSLDHNLHIYLPLWICVLGIITFPSAAVWFWPPIMRWQLGHVPDCIGFPHSPIKYLKPHGHWYSRSFRPPSTIVRNAAKELSGAAKTNALFKWTGSWER